MRTPRTSRPLDYRIAVKIWVFTEKTGVPVDGVKTTTQQQHTNSEAILEKCVFDGPLNHDLEGLLALHYFFKQQQSSLCVFLICSRKSCLFKNDGIWAEKRACAILYPNYLWQLSDGRSNTKIRVSGMHIFEKCPLIPLFLGSIVPVLRYKSLILVRQICYIYFYLAPM